MPSASLSGSGQPSVSSWPSRSSGSLGQSSILSLMPSASLSSSGQPSWSSKPSLSSGTRGQSSSVSMMPSPSKSTGLAGGGGVDGVAQVLGRLLDRGLGVGLGDRRLALGREVVALRQRLLGEVVVGLGHRQLDRRAAQRAVVARGLDQLVDGAGARAHLGAGAAGDHQQREEREQRAAHHGVPSAGASTAGVSSSTTGARPSLPPLGARRGGVISSISAGLAARRIASALAWFAASVDSRP
jgi:hypothetical protein